VYRALPIVENAQSHASTNGKNRSQELTVDRCLSTQLFKYFGGTGKSITRLADGDVEDEFLDAELPHGVGTLFFARFRLHVLLASLYAV